MEKILIVSLILLLAVNSFLIVQVYESKQVTVPNIVAVGVGGVWVDVPERQQIVWTPNDVNNPSPPDFGATPLGV